MKITSIKAQVKNTERVSIYVDEKYAFSLGYTQLLDQKIHVGLEIDELRLSELKHISEFGKAYERALMYAMLRPRSVREVRDYARRKKWGPEDTEAIIEKLISKRYLDDGVFARAWVENRAMMNKTSKRKLQMELKQKGVTDDIITETLADSTFNEGDALRQLIEKKRKLTRYASDDQKLMRYLASQGFGFDDIKSALEALA
jgi:regulatory protein